MHLPPRFRAVISIHALREEGDIVRPAKLSHTPDFYPRPPRGGRLFPGRFSAVIHDFYPRPPRGGRLPGAVILHHASVISIHALREEGDVIRLPTSIMRDIFLSTPSARRATNAPRGTDCTRNISIHALREEGDLGDWGIVDGLVFISIHALREEGDDDR